MPRRLVFALGLALLAPSTPAQAAEPIMPLSEVRSGMDCTGLSVVRGTEISEFDFEVIAPRAALTASPLPGRRSSPRLP